MVQTPRARFGCGWNVVALGLLVLDQLIAPWFGTLLQAISTSTGVELSFETASFRPFSGLELEQVEIRNPEPFDRVAPVFLKLEKASISWDLASLLDGGFRVQAFALRGLHIQLVTSDGGDSSITRLSAGLPSGDPEEKEKVESTLSASPMRWDSGGSAV